MAKCFTEHEKELIKQKLQESCEENWGRFGYKKTNVDELCKMAGISTGAFYMFYESKEMLFVDTLNKVKDRFNNLMGQTIPQNPTKYDYANLLKLIFHELGKTPWILKIQSDIEVFIRKLPADYLPKSFNNDIADFTSMIKKYNLKPKVSVDLITSMTWILVSSIPNKTIVGDHFTESMDLIIDSIIEKFFN